MIAIYRFSNRTFFDPGMITKINLFWSINGKIPCRKSFKLTFCRVDVLQVVTEAITVINTRKLKLWKKAFCEGALEHEVLATSSLLRSRTLQQLACWTLTLLSFYRTYSHSNVPNPICMWHWTLLLKATVKLQERLPAANT